MSLFKKNPFGHILFIKKGLIYILGLLTHNRYCIYNRLKIQGTEIINNLPDKNVLFISNHQTYFADVMAMYHVINASLYGQKNNLKNPFLYLLHCKLNLYYVAAKETMKTGLLPRIFTYVGGVTVERTWREKGVNIIDRKEVNPKDTENIKIALNDGWVITFPQGTTKPFSPIRKGTAHIIKNYKPIVVPIVIDGFRRSFDKKGLRLKKRKVLQSLIIKEPLKIDYENDTVDEIIEKIAFSIEQDRSFLKVTS